MRFRFTLTHGVDSLEISEPDGWKDGVIHLERDKRFHSLIEYYEGGGGGAFIFYGQNDEVNGGIDFIRDVETTYGVNSSIQFLAEFAPDDDTFSTIFSGKLLLSSIEEMPDNKMKVAVTRDDMWAKFINRMETPVDIQSTTTLDETSCDPAVSITQDLPSQKIQKKYEGFLAHFVLAFENEWTVGQYFQLDMNEEILDEIEEKYSIPSVTNPSRPSPILYPEYGGTHTFDLRIESSARVDSPLSIVNSQPYINWFVQINDDTPLPFSETNYTDGFGLGSTVYTFNSSLYLTALDNVRIYGAIIGNIGPLGVNAHYFIWSMGTISTPSGAGSGTGDKPTYFNITAQTEYPATQAEAFLIYDVGAAIIDRMTSVDPFYSEFLGSTLTNSRVYDEDGCGWMYSVIKGLHIRGYTLAEKRFFMSFDQWWNGIQPILSLGLSYDTVDTEEVIRVEQLAHFYDETVSINFSNVRDITRTYDNELIFKTIKTGYKKGQSEDASGIDDPQKQTRATIFKDTGTDLNLESDFIAASLAIETTRRTTRKKSADYKYDDETFIIALNADDVSPDRYTPELDENFDSITNLLNSNTRYNSILTPLRNFLRWANYIGGCLQSYTSSSYKFVSAEGNYDMVSDYSCATGNECQAIICDSLAENTDISLATYNATLGYLHLPLEYEIKIPMEWEEYEAIRNNRKKAIGISQTTTGHVPFSIKDLAYSLVEGKATIKAWPKTFFTINVIETTPETEC